MYVRVFGVGRSMVASLKGENDTGLTTRRPGPVGKKTSPC